MYDVIVVGAGPAGSIAAREAAKGGLNALLLDRRKEIGAPVRCGEGIGSYWIKELNIKFNPKWISAEITGALITGPSGKGIVLKNSDSKGFVIDRKVFDKELAIDAGRAGAEIIPKAEVIDLIKENGKIVGVIINEGGKKREINSKLVIAADGGESTVARMAGINSTASLYDTDFGIEYEMAGVECQDLIEVYLGKTMAPRGYCLTPDSPVLLKNTFKEIKEVGVGSEVLSMAGWLPVADTSIRDYSGDIVYITPTMLNTNTGLTADHLVWVWNKKQGFHWKKAKDLRLGKRGEHRIGDHLVVPIPSSEKITCLTLSDYFVGVLVDGVLYPKGRNQFGATFPYKHGITNKLLFNVDLMEFFGYFVSEGNVNSNGIIISNTNKQIIKRITEIGEKMFGFSPYCFTQRNCTQVQFPSRILRSLFSKLFGEGCRNKHLPPFVYGLDKKLKLALLKGLFLGDGTKERSSEGYEVLSYTTTSKSLVHDIWLLMASLGIVANIGQIKKKNAYRLRVRGIQLDSLSHIFGSLKHGNFKTNKGFIICDNWILLSIRKIEVRDYVGKVYDLQSAGSFCAPFLVHNCWIFPKGKDVVNVGVGIGGMEQGPAKNYLDKFIAAHPTRFKKSAVVAIKGGVIPVGAPLKELVKDNFMIVGTAAHMVDPIHGGGICLAMESGLIAGKAAVTSIETDNTSESALKQLYENKWKETREKSLLTRLLLRKAMEKLNDDDYDIIFEALGPSDVDLLLQGNFAPVVKKVLLKRPQLLKVLQALL